MTEDEIRRRLEEQGGRCVYPCEDGHQGAPLLPGDPIARAYDNSGLVHLRCARVGVVPYTGDGLGHHPRLHLGVGGRVLSIGFKDTQDTILFLDRFPGEYDGEDPERGDIATLREWAAAVDVELGREEDES